MPGFSTADTIVAIATPHGRGALGVIRVSGPRATHVTGALVACGAAALKLFEKNKLTVTPTSEEVDVKAVLAKVTLGEVDAGIVYVTDVKAAGDKVVGVEIPAANNVTSTYQAATVKASANADAAAKFVQYLTGPDAQSVLAAAAFAPAS